ncbi:MAG TPA: ABC transporter permease [Balneolaceae bacterium]|nr:ABC transporter permease [Balneolaceae bacterium]
MGKKSPTLAKILDVILPPDLHHLIGDLEEEYHQNITSVGATKARLIFWSQVIRTAPYFIFKSLTWNLIMLLNYLKVTWRNIRKHKSFSLINILGLAASMSVCLLIILFIVDQKSYDQFNSKAGRIYRITTNYKSPSNNEAISFATSPASLTDKLNENYPSVEKAIHIRGGFSGEMKYDDDTFKMEGLYTEPDFFRLFDFKLLKGNPKTALAKPGSVILTRKAARKIFGDNDPMGKTLTELGDRNYTVTGIIDKSVKTHFQFEALVSYATLLSNPQKQKMLDDWTQSIYESYTYLLLKKGASIQDLTQKLPDLIASSYQDPKKESVIKTFQPQQLTSINLGPEKANEIGMVFPAIIAWFLIGFGVIIILIACFNYISLTVARAINRSKEVGVRKVMGAFRSNVVKQFLAESIVIAILSLIFALAILRWMLPEFNSLNVITFTKNQIDTSLLTDYYVYAIFFIFSVLIGTLAGLYPALYLSSFNPAKVLKGITTIRGLSAKGLRKTITVMQFTFSLVFIISTLILVKQFNFMINTDYGFNREHIVNIALQDIPYDRLEHQLQNQPSVASVAASSKIPALGSVTGVWMKTDSISDRIRGHYFSVDEHYISTMGLDLIAGRNFNPALATDSTDAVILSTASVKKLGLKNPQEALNKPVTIDKHRCNIIGVIKNFISVAPLQSHDPILLQFNPRKYRYAVVKTKAGMTSDFVKSLKKKWANIGSVYSLQYKIFDQQLHESPFILVFGDFLKVFGLISAFAILISCLGLLGMAMFSAENRVKEIGIRKVLGASISDIVLLLSKEYLLLIGIAVIIGTPLAWFINNLWMQNVTNRTHVGPLIFLLGIAGTAGLALLTIGSQTLRAARAKSIDNLKSE